MLNWIGRIRKPNCGYRDLTIRAQVRSNGKTEIHKIRDEGKGDIYFYAWTYDNLGKEQMQCYMLVDLNKLRQSGLLDESRQITSNGDGTGFVSYSKDELDRTGALLIYENIQP